MSSASLSLSISIFVMVSDSSWFACITQEIRTYSPGATSNANQRQPPWLDGQQLSVLAATRGPPCYGHPTSIEQTSQIHSPLPEPFPRQLPLPRCAARNRALGFAAGFKREFQLPLKIVIPTHRPLTLVVRVDDDFHINSPLARFIFLYTSHGSSLMADASFLVCHIPGATRILNFRCVNLKRIQRSAVFSSGNGRFGLGLT